MPERPDLLFDFAAPETAQRFDSVDDRVMGGVSRSAMLVTTDGAAFEGELSLERNGGFASVRSAPAPVDLSGSDGIELRVRGDGRTYKFRLRTDRSWDGVSYQAPFAPPPGEWTDVRLPFEAFQPTYRGRRPSNATPLDPAQVTTFGLLVADKQEGQFRLEIEWIRTF